MNQNEPGSNPRRLFAWLNHIKANALSLPYLSIVVILLFLFSPGLGLIQNLENSTVNDGDNPSSSLKKLTAGWTYAWVDTRLTDDNNRGITDSPSSNTQWKPIATPVNPPDRNGRHLLFLKNTIPDENWEDPALLIDGRGILLTFRAYIDGDLIFKFGELNSLGGGNLSGITSQIIPIDKRHLGKTITFKVFSDYSNIGIRGRVFFGSKADLIQYVAKKDISRLVIGILMVLIGLLDFFSYRKEIKGAGNTPMFGVLALALGLYTINVTTIKDFIFYAPVFWFNVYIVAMTLIPVGTIGFVWQTFRPRSGNFLHRLWQFHILYAAICQLVFLLTLYSLLSISVGTLMLNSLRWLLILEMAFIIFITVKDSIRHKDNQARIYLWGFIPIIISGIHDSLVGLGKISSSFSYVPWAMMGFILSLELIRRRMSIKMQTRLKNYAEQLESKSREKEELLRDLHDGIGGLVTHIKFLSEMGKNNPSKSGMQETLKNISDLSSESLIEIGNFMQSLDEDEMDWSNLLARFRQFGTSLLEDRDIKFKLSTTVKKALKNPDRILFINLLQIYKEAITNAAKHSGAKTVHVVVMLTQKDLMISIKDNGIGFGKNIVHGKGLSNMKARAQKIGGSLSVKSDDGTFIELDIPIKKQKSGT